MQLLISFYNFENNNKRKKIISVILLSKESKRFSISIRKLAWKARVSLYNLNIGKKPLFSLFLYKISNVIISLDLVCDLQRSACALMLTPNLSYKAHVHVCRVTLHNRLSKRHRNYVSLEKLVFSALRMKLKCNYCKKYRKVILRSFSSMVTNVVKHL